MREAPTTKPSPIGGWVLFFCGLCMGAADLVPGISGGTIAFILGVYQPLVESLQTLNCRSLKLLCQGQWQKFARQVAWRFLLPLLAGMLCAVVGLAHLFQFILSHELYRVYFYAVFFGLILASSVFCLRQVKGWGGRVVFAFCLGVAMGYILTDQTWDGQGNDAILAESQAYISFLHARLVISGALAMCAFLVPGISGSYILTLLGVYSCIIESLTEFLKGIGDASFRTEAFAVLWSLGMGIVLGALAFARIVRWLLHDYFNDMLALLSGLMIGTIRSVWPFWSDPPALFQGAQWVGSHPYIPSWDSPFLWQVVACLLGGFLIVFALEFRLQSQAGDVIPNNQKRQAS